MKGVFIRQAAIILKYALQNAVRYKGKANTGAVIAKVIGEGFKVERDRLVKEVNKIVNEVNAWGLEKQINKLKEIDPKALEKKKEERDIFSGIEVRDPIITCFPPEPSKHPHLGHAKSIFLNSEFAKKRYGKFILRFDDTNPKLIEEKYYKIHLWAYQWLGIEIDTIEYASDYVKDFKKYAEKLIEMNDAYVCICDIDDVRRGRFKGSDCPCRKNSKDENIQKWKDMQEMKEGVAILRLKVDMKHKNTAMRDPIIMRIIEGEHCRGIKERVWPSYDFESAIMDGLEGVNIRFRSKEFELRDELQNHIQVLLDFKETQYISFGRLSIEGAITKGREIRNLVKVGKLMGWDDPSLVTIAALRRRGFLPQAVKNFVLKSGISKAESVVKWGELEAQNRRLLDEKVNRYFFVKGKNKITIEGSKPLEVRIPLHPSLKRGNRVIRTDKEFYVDDKIVKGVKYRFMHLFNFEDGKFLSDEVDKKAKLIHWLPVTNELVKVEVLMPDHKVISGFGENYLRNIRIGDVVQFERNFFARFDHFEGKKMIFWYCCK